MSKRLTVTLVIVGIAITIYGVAQPLILHLAGIQTSGGNAETLSILVTIVAFFAAALGVGIYRLVNENLASALHATVNATVDARVDEVDALIDKTEKEVRRAVSLARGRSAYGLWISLVPFLIARPEEDSWEHALRAEIIDAGLAASASAVKWAEDDEINRTDPQVQNAIYTLAFYQACTYRFVETTNSDLRWKALGAIPSDEDEIKLLSPEKQETVAWVWLCCSTQGDPTWTRGVDLAKSLYLRLVANQRDEADSMKRRYESTFFEGVLD